MEEKLSRRPLLRHLVVREQDRLSYARQLTDEEPSP